MGIERMIDHTMLKARCQQRYYYPLLQRGKGASVRFCMCKHSICSLSSRAVKGKRSKDLLCSRIPSGSYAHKR